jgi:hypothetical protein
MDSGAVGLRRELAESPLAHQLKPLRRSIIGSVKRGSLDDLSAIIGAVLSFGTCAGILASHDGGTGQRKCHSRSSHNPS